MSEITCTVYPCCEKSCRLSWDPEAGKTTTEREHYCDIEDTIGTRYRIGMERVPIAKGMVVDRIDFLDMASDEAFGLYGTRRVPHRKERRERRSGISG